MHSESNILIQYDPIFPSPRFLPANVSAVESVIFVDNHHTDSQRCPREPEQEAGSVLILCGTAGSWFLIDKPESPECARLFSLRMGKNTYN